MNTKLATACLMAGFLLAPVIGHATDDADADRSDPKAFVKDSVITTKVKSKLAAEHFGSLVHIQVDTDSKGEVWLTGSAQSQADIDRAVAITRTTEGVKSVHNQLIIKKDD